MSAAEGISADTPTDLPPRAADPPAANSIPTRRRLDPAPLTTLTDPRS